MAASIIEDVGLFLDQSVVLSLTSAAELTAQQQPLPETPKCT